jgi:hypothetical protein
VTATPVTRSVPLPVFITVTAWKGLVAPTLMLPKSSIVGAMLTTGTDVVTPSPVSVTAWGLPGASSVTVRNPLRVPSAVGVKVTSIVQEAPADSAAGAVGQVDVATAKSPLARMA